MGFFLNKPVSLGRTDSERVYNLMEWANNTTEAMNVQMNSLSAKNFGGNDAKALKDLDDRLTKIGKSIEKMGKQISALQSLANQLDERVTALEERNG